MSASRLFVTIDPGHGGRQPGAVGPTGLLEKDVCLAVSLRVRELLRGQVTVHLTREVDVHVPLEARLPAAGSTAYISIHCNAFGNSAANGTETFRHHARGISLATVLQRHLVAQLRLRNRGVKTGAFQVIRQTTIPAALVELAFISNLAEEVLLRSADGQERAARAIADGVIEFLQPATVPAGPPRRTHTVVARETLWGISRRYGVSVAQLEEWNRLAPNSGLRIGQVLFLSA